MTKLIGKDHPRFFEQTCYKPYDRHHYKIVHKDRSIMVESWDEVQEWWWNNCRLPTFDAIVHVIDKPKTKKKSKGF